MIKLEEKKIQIIQLRIISIEYICNYFADANHYDTILLIYDGDNYLTNISYDEICICREEKELTYFLRYIFRQKSVNSCEDMLNEATKIFDNNSYISYILLRDSVNFDQAFFYHCTMDVERYQKAMEYVKSVLKKKGVSLYFVRIPECEEIREEKRHKEWKFGYFTAPINWSLPRKREMEKYLHNFTERTYDDAREDVLHKIKCETYGGGEYRTIFIVGPCIAGGWENCKGESLPSILHKMLSCAGVQYKVKEVVVEESINSKLFAMLEFDIGKEDIVIWITDYMDKAICDFDLTSEYNQYNGGKWLYSDIPIHTTKYGNEMIADGLIKNIIKPFIEKVDKDSQNTVVHIGEKQLSSKEQDELYLYIERIKKDEIDSRDVIGACVVTCNPFTLGHYYLIEYASRRVDVLYVFVVEEDAFRFSFTDRIEMVRRGTSCFNNVIVLPSGNFMISNITFKNYFEKEVYPDIVIDAVRDVTIFKNYIAPILGISKRFVGEEPEDNITAQYNRLLKEGLNGVVDVIEIPRKKKDDEIISASKVRGYIARGDWKEIEKIVPDTTLEYLKTNLIELQQLKRSSIPQNVIRLMEFIRSHQNIVICGMGIDAQKMMWQLDWNMEIEEERRFIYYDKSLAVQNRSYRGTRVIDLEELIKKYKNYYMVITSRKSKMDIFCDLTENGIVPEHIMVFGEVI